MNLKILVNVREGVGCFKFVVIGFVKVFDIVCCFGDI